MKLLKPSTVLLSCCTLTILSGPLAAENWPCWRGPRGDGTSQELDVPIKWDGATGENIAWRVPVSGRGHCSPIVWEDRIFITTCDENQETRLLLCYNRQDGSQLWQREVVRAPLEKKHTLNSFASGTPATDGKQVYVTFLEPDFGSRNQTTPGNMVVAAYGLDGKQHWLVRPGRFSSTHGYCSSPILFNNTVIVNGDHDGDAYIVALDCETGKEVWRRERSNKTRSYVTPIIREIDGRMQMVLSGSKSVVSLDPSDGSRHWIIDGPTEQFVASLVYDGRLLFMTAGFPEFHILAIRPNGEGNVTNSAVVWRTTKGCSYVPSPIVAGDFFLVAKDTGIASCFDTATGKHHWMKRLAPHFSASLVSANGLVHFLSDEGETTIVRPGKTLDVVRVNKLGEDCYGSPAISQGHIYLRAEQHLYSIGP